MKQNLTILDVKVSEQGTRLSHLLLVMMDVITTSIRKRHETMQLQVE